jgi:hypothetical protein
MEHAVSLLKAEMGRRGGSKSPRVPLGCSLQATSTNHALGMAIAAQLAVAQATSDNQYFRSRPAWFGAFFYIEFLVLPALVQCSSS